MTASTYKSYSELGSSISGNATVGDLVLTRKPVDIKGYEISGEVNFSKAWKFTALYSHVEGMTSTAQAVPGQPTPKLDLQLGVNDVSPNKLVMSLNWKMDSWSARLGSPRWPRWTPMPAPPATSTPMPTLCLTWASTTT